MYFQLAEEESETSHLLDFNKCPLLSNYARLCGITAAWASGKKTHKLTVTNNILIDVAEKRKKERKNIIKTKLD